SLSMGSFKANGRGNGPNRRRGNNNAKRRGTPRLEFLEGRVLLAGGNPIWKPTSTNLADVRNGPMANLGGDLIAVYQKYLANHGDVASIAKSYPSILFQDSKVGVGLKSLGGDFNQFTSSLQSLGMQITASSAFYGLAEGWLPINQLVTVAQLPGLMS